MSVPDHVRERREAARRAVRRRRLVVGGGLLLVVALVLVIAGAFDGGPAATHPVPAASGGSSTTPSRRPADGHPASRAPAPATGSYRGPVPILMYHVVTAAPAGTAYPELWTPADRFAATMRLLADQGYRGVTLDAVWRAWHGGPGLPAKAVVVSFDDGYLSQYTHAKPVLRRLGWPGVLNLEGKSIGPGGLTTRQLRTMIAAGWQIGAHSLTHPDLTVVGDARLRAEVAGSKALLERRLGVTVTTFCYPAGRNDARVRAAVRAAGYLNATTVDPGIATARDDPFLLPRIRVNGTDAPAAVLDRVRTGSGAEGTYG